MQARCAVIGTGLSGLVGTRIVDLLKDQCDFTNLSYETGIDITDATIVEKTFEESPATVVFHLAAKADVDGCEQDKDQGKDGAAWKINVEGTRNIVTAAKNTGKKVFFVSTDFVFDGTQEFYSEKDTPNPLNWYGVTKYEAEKIVLEHTGNTVIRISYPYASRNLTAKKDFIHQLYYLLKDGRKLTLVTDHIMTPTYIDDIAEACFKLFTQNITEEIYHIVGSSYHSPYEIAQLLCSHFELDSNLLYTITMKDYYQGKANRPLALRLKNDKISTLTTMKSFVEGLAHSIKDGFI